MTERPPGLLDAARRLVSPLVVLAFAGALFSGYSNTAQAAVLSHPR